MIKYGDIMILILLLVIPSATNSCRESVEKQPIIKVALDTSVFNGTVSGKLLFLFDPDTTSQVIYGIDPGRPSPLFTYDVKNHNASDTIIIEAFDKQWSGNFDMLRGEYVTRLIFDCDTLNRSPFVTRGNGYSARMKVSDPGTRYEPLLYEVKGRFDGWVFNETENVSEIRFRSETLSKFWGRDIFIEAAIILPPGYNNSEESYKEIYIFPGFGSSHASITYGSSMLERYGIDKYGEDKIYIYLNGEFFQGYHHFSNSDNNGPWADALINEFIPFIEDGYRTIGSPQSRFLMGQSSGAWTALHLQVGYPEMFAGAFAASPDPVDFRAMGFDIYSSGANYYFPHDPDTSDIRKGAMTRLLTELEHVSGEFGQVRSWEATFSPAGADGLPSPLFDIESGEIDPVVAEYWRRYDIGWLINSEPSYYRDRLNNKLHIYVSNDDPYDLDRGVRLLDHILGSNNIGADIIYYEGLGHFVWSDELRIHIYSYIDQ